MPGDGACLPPRSSLVKPPRSLESAPETDDSGGGAVWVINTCQMVVCIASITCMPFPGPEPNRH